MSDPTRIDLATDPTKLTMSGIARHGNTPFECTIISHVDGNLWQGGCEGGLTLPENIVHVVSLYPWERFAPHPHGDVKTTLYITAYDSDPEHIAPMLDHISDWVIRCMNDGPTLVHCQAGLNRSSLVAALVLMKQGRTAANAISLLREKRSPAVLCNQSFVRWLMNVKPEEATK